MKKKDLYLPNGYLNFDTIFECPYNFIFVVGGRGIGKTYGALEKMYIDKIKFMFMRRTQTQADIICTPEYNPYKTLNEDKGWHIYPKKQSKYTFGFYEGYIENEQIVVDKNTEIAKGAALSTFANIRGFDASDIDVLILDEFIKQLEEREMRGEADAFLNMLESVGRNRELLGKKPLKVLCFSNSTDVSAPIFIELGIVSSLMKLKTKGEFIYEDKERGLIVIMPKDSPISEKKKYTALYRFAKGTSFYQSAIDNDFAYNSFTSVRTRPLNEYKPLVNVGELCIYKHKSFQRLYVSNHKMGGVPTYTSSTKDLIIFKRRFIYLVGYVYSSNIDYENYACEVIFDKYLNFY